jgi:peptidoglycan hydrolase FlgJ
MAAPPRIQQGLAGDQRNLAALRSQAAADPKAVVREAAKQFEALFMQELLKSMRASTLATGTLENEGSRLGTEMLDQQLATQMTGLPGGLADAIARQLERQMLPNAGPASGSTKLPAPAEPLTRIPGKGAAAFIDKHLDAADKAAAASGIPAAFMIGQAAHETGWGRSEIRRVDGSASFNLFGIKAGPDWKGAVAEVGTTEFVNGQAQKVSAKFRAYASYEESFADYARLISASPRYKEALAAGSNVQAFASGLQRGGYATDPAYADKLARVINTTLRLQRASG